MEQGRHTMRSISDPVYPASNMSVFMILSCASLYNDCNDLLCTQVKVSWNLWQKLIVMISLRLSMLTSQVRLGFHDAMISAFVCACIVYSQLALLW